MSIWAVSYTHLDVYKRQSYIIIHRNANRIKRYKQETADLIERLQQMAKRNEALITLSLIHISEKNTNFVFDDHFKRN